MLGKQFDNVFSLDASRAVKEKTGRGVAVRAKQDSPEMVKHENEAMALGNPVEKKKSRYDAVMEYLGL